MDYSFDVLLNVVKRKSQSACQIRWPTVEEIKVSSSLLGNNRVCGSFLRGVFAVTDGEGGLVLTT